MQRLTNKRIVLGVTGSIAAYKCADLVRRLREVGAEVRVVMTQAACAFVAPLTLQALSGQPVRRDLFDLDAEAAMGHIDLARWADIVLIAPASADCLARLAKGRANDLLSALCLATQAPITVAPAMNQAMWANPRTQAHVHCLVQAGMRLLGPATGDLACGENGAGRMLEISELVEAVAKQFQRGDLAGLHVLITAGPTREPIDPVRFISNRSSGKMGYAMAQAAIEAGAKVTLISGPVHLVAPERAHCVQVETAKQMYSAVLAHVDGCDIFIATAAVSDYRCERVNEKKIKKEAFDLTLKLAQTTDIVHTVALRANRPFVVGFAAQTHEVIENARDKLERKGLDVVIANQVGIAQSGFDVDDNALAVLWRGGQSDFPLASKSQLAGQVTSLIATRYHMTKDKLHA